MLKYSRKKKTIINHESNKTKVFDSINLAKKESRRIQMQEDGGLGRGCLRAIN